ncbi:hypothetical protein DEO72_LG11g2948 [Vigna unguiculata]|uniref:Uncharacterized protein n=1 Tax=Vigna unguiculata TaxID=3917 RepID=A0A4D6NUI4_VIGUN|nr:hypothetical protein DEO72_LG11g2947 [Vigna unguiculata]QCE15935.1 hypothetical protein DEO72_LG11g2948 [Vigna unguiculata]
MIQTNWGDLMTHTGRASLTTQTGWSNPKTHTARTNPTTKMCEADPTTQTDQLHFLNSRVGTIRISKKGLTYGFKLDHSPCNKLNTKKELPLLSHKNADIRE